MPLTELLFSFKGRIRRLHFWVAALAIGAAAATITAVLDLAAGATGSFTLVPDTETFEPTGPFAVGVFAVGAANLWINFALSVKRLHDRDRTGWWLLWQTLILVAALLLLVVALVVPKEQAPTWYVIAGLVGTVALAVTLWLFVEMGFLRGTQGPNRFGPDPLGASQADASI
jgi:uncharacterized membrane protein YhaH (DUF805 family)